MRYSVEPSYRIYFKGYTFLSFKKNMGKREHVWAEITDKCLLTPQKSQQQMS